MTTHAAPKPAPPVKKAPVKAAGPNSVYARATARFHGSTIEGDVLAVVLLHAAGVHPGKALDQVLELTK